ncbi:histidinol-phosphatase (PHP family) [Paenibacillus sp. RC73]|uniref:Histidinol-phosphatase n=1 Tax=Paenibacillus terrae TaxID=159743 RepID=A0A0D7X197_9BACL|nr:histidinol-phosphatase HisJ family protein [Paenibacillus terrae]KJD45200.1 histidinol phosphatase [Paenibacillus terrae]
MTIFFLSDYHVHTRHSFDSQADMFDVCRSAMQQGMTEICFTEHFAVNPKLPTYGHMSFADYFDNITACREACSSQLTIRVGIELCEPHLMMDEYADELRDLPLDMILGSVHNMNEKTLRTFLKENEHTGVDVYEAYFLEVLNLVRHADIDIIAHLDLLKRYAHGSVGHYSFAAYAELLETVLKTAISRGIGIEINTSGIRGGVGSPFPSPEVLRLYKQLGGELLTIGTDSHKVEDTGADLKEAYALAKQCGFHYVFTYANRKPMAVKLD